MRVSPVGWAFEREDDVVREAARTAAPTHDHSEGIRGAEATALAVYLARHGADKVEIRRRVAAHSGYDLGRTVDEIRPGYSFNESCNRTVPEALTCFLEARDFEHAVRLAVSLGGDADTLACIAGAVAEAHWGGVPEPIRNEVMARLVPDLCEVLERFENWRRERRGAARQSSDAPGL
jgi:ADP-ribosylglycohydrolase